MSNYVNFIHAIEMDDRSRLDETVLLIAQLLCQENIMRISQLLSGLAKGSRTIDQVTDFLVKEVESKSSIVPQSCLLAAERNKVITRIRHDCGGASAVAWLSISNSHMNSPPPWEIYEEFDGTSVVTVSTCTEESVVYSLSEYLHQVIFNHELHFQKELNVPSALEPDSLVPIIREPNEKESTLISKFKEWMKKIRSLYKTCWEIGFFSKPRKVLKSISQQVYRIKRPSQRGKDRKGHNVSTVKKGSTGEWTFVLSSGKKHKTSLRNLRKLCYEEQLNRYEFTILTKNNLIFTQEILLFLPIDILDSQQKHELNNLIKT
jgi:hypothetical protein